MVSNPVERDLALHQSLPDLHQNLLRGFGAEPGQVQQGSGEGSGEGSRKPWCKSESRSGSTGFRRRFRRKSGFSGTFLIVTWLCTKASQTFSGTFGAFSGTSLNLSLRLHQCTPQLFWAEDPISLRCWGKRQKNTTTLKSHSLSPNDKSKIQHNLNFNYLKTKINIQKCNNNEHKQTKNMFSKKLQKT